jgi:hypothetical protein
LDSPEGFPSRDKCNIFNTNIMPYVLNRQYSFSAIINVFVHLAEKLEALFFGDAADEGAFANEVFYPVLHFFTEFPVIGVQRIDGVKGDVCVIGLP